jgi:hypothetical protein
MSSTPPIAQVSVDVVVAFARATDALRGQNIDGVVDALSTAADVYEQHPSYAHEPLSQLHNVLLWIRAGRSLCATLGRSDRDFADLESRAEVLAQPLH